MRRIALLLVAGLTATSAAAEQFHAFGDIEVHYSVVNTLFLDKQITDRYGIERGGNRAIVNVAVLDASGTPIATTVTGSTLNLLNREETLAFRTITEPPSVYNIAPLRYTDGDVLRFRLEVQMPEREPMRFEFQQRMYVAPDP
jgi:Domain of unknown function (DUF4426)